MAEEWSEWFQHDGTGCPPEIVPGLYVAVRHRSGLIKAGLVRERHVKARNWVWPKPCKDPENDVVAYRIRKPRGLTILQEIVTNPEKELEGADG